MSLFLRDIKSSPELEAVQALQRDLAAAQEKLLWRGGQPVLCLADLLLALFSADELRRLCRYIMVGETALAERLPDATSAPRQTAAVAASLLFEAGATATDLRVVLSSERPNRRGDIANGLATWPW